MVPRIIDCPYVIARLETMDRLKDPRVPFHNALEATGLDWLTFRDFRHFRASQWVMDGVDFKTVQGLMVFGYSHNDEVCALRTQSCQPEHIEAQRKEGKPAADAIYQACLIRFRPIMMTTFAALMGSLPIALSFGAGGDARRPLGPNRRQTGDIRNGISEEIPPERVSPSV